MSNTSRHWTRFENKCPNYSQYTREELNMRRKAEILKHKQNTVNLSKKHHYALLAKGSLRQQKSWGSQSHGKPTSANSKNLPRTGNTLVFSCNQNNCASSTSSGVPGPPVTLCYNATVPLHNYKRRYTYIGGNEKPV